jgi:transposase
MDMTISILGIDIAKNTFQLHGADNTGKATLKKRLPHIQSIHRIRTRVVKNRTALINEIRGRCLEYAN